MRKLFAPQQHFRKFYTALGLLLAQGAPIGYVIHNRIFDDQAVANSTLAYIWVGTTVFFGIFGWLLGSSAEKLSATVQQLRQAVELLTKFKEARNQSFANLTTNRKTPFDTTRSFLEAYRKGDLGPVQNENVALATASLQELDRLHKSLQRLLHIYNVNSDDYRFSSTEDIEKQIAQISNLTVFIESEGKFPVACDSGLFFNSLKEILLSLAKTLPQNKLTLRITRNLPEDQSDDWFIYLVIESQGEKLADAKEAWPWIVAQTNIAWLGGHSWIDPKFTQGLRFVIALPNAKLELSVPQRETA